VRFTTRLPNGLSVAKEYRLVTEAGSPGSRLLRPGCEQSTRCIGRSLLALSHARELGGGRRRLEEEEESVSNAAQNLWNTRGETASDLDRSPQVAHRLWRIPAS